MKFGTVIFIIVCTTAANVKSYKFSKIDDVQENIQFIEFEKGDSPNVYIGGNHATGATIYKLNSKKEIIVKDELQLKNIQKIFIYNNNAYIFDANSVVFNGGSIFFLGRGALQIEKLFEFPLEKDQPYIYFYSQHGIYFNTATGVAVLKIRDYEERGLTVPKSIENLEHFSITGYHTIGVSDNEICLGGTFKGDPNPKVAIIQRGEQSKELPSADVKNMSNPSLNLITAAGNDPFKNNALIAFSGPIARIFKVGTYDVYEQDRERRITKTELEPIFGEYLQYFGGFYSAGLRTYFFASNLFTGDCYLNYADNGSLGKMTSYKFSSIPNVNFLGADYDCEHVTFTSDSNRDIFFTMKKKVFSLKGDETEIKEVIFPHDKPECDVKSLLVDKDKRLWILAGDLFMVPKNELEARQITNYSFAVQSGIMKIHPKTKEIFIGSEHGLHVYSD